jgi:hypothetical protein
MIKLERKRVMRSGREGKRGGNKRKDINGEGKDKWRGRGRKGEKGEERRRKSRKGEYKGI